MDEKTNALRPATGAPPKFSPAALASAGAALLAILGILLSSSLFALGHPELARYAAYLQLTFPLSIGFGHAALRRIARDPSRYQGKTVALLGLYVGYFNLAAVILIVSLMLFR